MNTAHDNSANAIAPEVTMYTPKAHRKTSHTPSPEVLLENQIRQARQAEEMQAEFRRLKHQLAEMALNQEKESSTTPPKKRNHAPKLKEKKKNPKCELEQIDLTGISKKLKDSCHLLMRCLMCRENGQSALPLPPNTFYSRELQKFLPEDRFPDNNSRAVLGGTDIRAVSDLDGKIDRDYIDYIHMSMRRWSIRFFTFDWLANFEDRFNQIVCQFFIKVWKWGLTTMRLGLAATEEAQRIKMDDMILLAIVWKHMQYLKSNYKKLTKNSDALKIDQARNSHTVALPRKSEARQKALSELGVAEEYIEVFDNRHVNSDDEFEEDPACHNVRIRYSKVPYWRSEVATKFIDWTEEKIRFNSRIRITGLKNRAKVGPQITPQAQRSPPVIDELAVVPAKLPEDWYRPEFLSALRALKKEELQIKPWFFPRSGDFNQLVPTGALDITMTDQSAGHDQVVNRNQSVEPNQSAERHHVEHNQSAERHQSVGFDELVSIMQSGSNGAKGQAKQSEERGELESLFSGDSDPEDQPMRMS